MGILILAGIWFFGRQEPAGEQIEHEQPQVQTQSTVTLNGYELGIEIVRTSEDQARGLSGRGSLRENTGMFFVYEEPLIPSFWMKDMNFPIDIIWVGNDKRIVDISENIAPETFPQLFRPRAPVQYVLEVNAGWAKTHTVSVGNEIVLNLGE